LGVLNFGGPVTCLAVRGNSATLNFSNVVSGFGLTTVQVTDNPDSFDMAPLGRDPTDCSPLPPMTVGGATSGGDITVIDAPPLPANKDQCKNGGWRSFGFKNQGQCVAFVIKAKVCETLARHHIRLPICLAPGPSR
jgi:hypothetical protein